MHLSHLQAWHLQAWHLQVWHLQVWHLHWLQSACVTVLEVTNGEVTDGEASPYPLTGQQEGAPERIPPRVSPERHCAIALPVGTACDSEVA